MVWLNEIEFLGIHGKIGYNKGREKGHKMETQIGFDLFDNKIWFIWYLFLISPLFIFH